MPEILQIIIGILLFAVATAVLYAWGIWKSVRQKTDLSQMLYSKAAKKVKKYLEKNGEITFSEIQNQVRDIKAGLFYTNKKAVVTDKKQFAANLVQIMEKADMIEENSLNHKKNYRLKGKRVEGNGKL